MHARNGGLLNEILEGLLITHHVVEQDEYFVAQALVLQLVARLHDVLEELFQRRDDVLDGEQLDGADADRLDRVPDDLEATLDDVGAKINALEDDVDDVLQDSEVGELLCELFVEDARRDELE